LDSLAQRNKQTNKQRKKGRKMNKTQRNSNRRNARKLAKVARQRIIAQHTCENCGKKGGHWVVTRPTSVMGLITKQDDQEGFWDCPKDEVVV
jgi:N-acetylmuramoyl-L-alanine amidase